jgi:hypothetical protein
MSIDYDDMTATDIDENEADNGRHDVVIEREIDLAAQIDKLTTTALAIKAQNDELRALLADIALGADMMLEPALGLKGAMLGYVREVKRVASAGRSV